MSIESEHHTQPEDGIVCQKCLLVNMPTAAFCADCGAPIGMISTVDPIQHILAEGFAYRSSVEGPPKLIIVIGMWLLFGPVVLVAPFLIFECLEADFSSSLSFILLAIGLVLSLLTVGSAMILYRITKNYIVRFRSFNDLRAAAHTAERLRGSSGSDDHR
jgi:hypothetical protein